MKNKRLIAFFCALAFMAVIVVGCGVVFTFKKAEVYFVNEQGQYVQVEKEKEDNIQTECIKSFFGKNLLFLDTSAVAEKVEQANLDLKAEKVEKAYPKKIRIFVSVRIKLYYLQVDGENYICSYDGFVMQKSDDVSDLVKVDGDYGEVSGLSVGSYIKGSFANADNYMVVQNFFASVHEIEGFEYGDISSLFKSITFENEKLVCQTQSGATFVFAQPTVDFSSKFDDVYSSYVANADKQDNGTFICGERQPNGKYSVDVQ
ncbi:MAG: hypothetical protein IJ999_04990 [Clostridia bacterium]|nr:hypothetical protein [Clostridia bacterium]